MRDAMALGISADRFTRTGIDCSGEFPAQFGELLGPADITQTICFGETAVGAVNDG